MIKTTENVYFLRQNVNNLINLYMKIIKLHG